MRSLKALPFIGLIAIIAKFAVKILAGVIMLGIVYSFATKDFTAINYVLSPESPVVKLYKEIYDKIPDIIVAIKTTLQLSVITLP